MPIQFHTESWRSGRICANFKKLHPVFLNISTKGCALIICNAKTVQIYLNKHFQQVGWTNWHVRWKNRQLLSICLEGRAWSRAPWRGQFASEPDSSARRPAGGNPGLMETAWPSVHFAVFIIANEWSGSISLSPFHTGLNHQFILQLLFYCCFSFCLTQYRLQLN